MKYTFRTRFKKEIVAGYLPPSKKSDKVIIFCQGMPTNSSKVDLINFFSKKGYWIFVPRYRGTWESDGDFLKYSPEKDIIDVIDSLPRGFEDAYTGKIHKIKPSRITLIGSSFGGPAAILASRDKRVDAVIAIAPVIDWRKMGRDEPIDWVEKFTRKGFGQGYRFSHQNWKKLSSGEFYSPMHEAASIDGSKVTIFQAKDDGSVPYRTTVSFSKRTCSRLFLLKRGGHAITGYLTKPSFFKKIKKFL